MRDLSELWGNAVEQFGDRTAAIFEGEETSYAELDRMIGAFATSLRNLGVERGDRVALLMPNCLHSIICYLGAVRAGATALPVNIRLKPEEMRFILGDAAPTLAVIHERVWGTASQAIDESLKVVGVGLDDDWVIPAEALLNEEPLTPHEAGRDDVAAIIYTSGTTGLPKGAMITHSNVLFNVEATISGHGFRPDDVHILAVPLFHVTGLNTIMPTAFHQGARVVVTAQVSPRDILRLIEQHGATTWFGVPTTMILLSQLPDIDGFDLTSLRLIAYSGAPMPVRTIAKLREMFPGVKLHNFFGLTETTSCTTVLPDEQAIERAESIGRAAPGIELRIDAEPGEVGELLVRAPSVVPGYYDRPDATAEAIVDGWLHTGDTAIIDDEGYVFLKGRQKEMIIVGGENVYPIEVENVLTRHPAVAEVAAVGAPHKVFGEVVRAVVVLRPEAEADARELKRHCVEHVASYKVPQIIEFRESLPRNPSGKVVKRLLVDDG